jgi:hypothetical protein
VPNPTTELCRPELQQRAELLRAGEGIGDGLAAGERDCGEYAPLNLGSQQRALRDATRVELRDSPNGARVVWGEAPDDDAVGMKIDDGMVSVAHLGTSGGGHLYHWGNDPRVSSVRSEGTIARQVNKRNREFF